MANAPAFQLFASDFFMDTISWTAEEVGVYTRLLLAQWTNGPLENDIERLARTSGISKKRFTFCFQNVSCKFQKSPDGKLYNLRLEETRQKQKSYIEIQRLRGRKSADKRSTTATTTVQPRLGATPQPDGQPKGNSSSSSSYNAFISNDIKAGDTPPPASPLEEKKNKHFTSQITDQELITRLQEVGKFWDGKNEFNPWAWIQVGIKKRRHPMSLLRTLERLKESINKGAKIDNIIAYATKIVDIESKNYREADAIAAHERLKKELEKLYPKRESGIKHLTGDKL